MSVMPYLIDGHNLIPKLGLRLDSPDDELELIAILQEYSRLSRRGSEVYFDGAPAGQAGMKKFGAVTAHFVRLGTTADSAIRARLKKLARAARNWIVVSSDHEVQNAASAAHAAVASSEEFAGQLKRLQHSARKPKGERELSSEEVDEWIKLFNQKK
jgi:predicted RNA-binding protein with PIN domain